MNRKRDRIFLMALGVSLMFHLSTVTLFRIVIYFPDYDSAYHRVDIIKSTGVSAFTQAFKSSSDGTEASTRFEGDETTSEFHYSSSKFPSVDLPRLSFSKLRLPRSTEIDLNTRRRYEELFDSEPDDLWAQVGEKLSTIGELFTHNSDSDTPAPETIPQRISAGQPAPGFEAFLEWMAPPYARQAMFVEKIDALWGADPSVLTDLSNESLVLVFRVNPAGRVTFVQRPLEDEAGVVKSSAEALERYRFAPLLEGTDDQHGTLTIRARQEEGRR